MVENISVGHVDWGWKVENIRVERYRFKYYFSTSTSYSTSFTILAKKYYGENSQINIIVLAMIPIAYKNNLH